MASNPYQFESSGGYGLGTSTNYGGNEYGYDLNDLSGGDPSSGQNKSGLDFNLKRPKFPKVKGPAGNPAYEPAYEPVRVPNTNPNFNTNFNPLGVLGTIGGILGGVLGGQQQGQGNVSPQGAVAGGSSGSEQVSPNTSSPDNAGIRPSSNRDLIGDNLKNAYSTPSQFRSPELPTIGYGDAGAAQAAASQAGAGSVTPEQSSQWRMQQAQEANRAAHSTTRDYSSLYASPSLPTIGYGDAGAAQAAASQAGAGSVTPEQSSQWRMEQAQAANQRAHSTPRDYSSITNANAQRTQQAQEANRRAHSTPRDYSSLSSQFRSPELPTIGYDNPEAAGSAAYNSGGWEPAPRGESHRLIEAVPTLAPMSRGWDAFANWTSNNIGEKLGRVVDDVEEGSNPANWKYTDPSGNTYTGAAAAAMAAMYTAAGAVAGNDLSSQMFLIYYDE
jgi:hypothetical protein